MPVWNPPPAGGGVAFSAGVSNIGNTLGNTGTVSKQVVLAGGNNITLSQSTNAGGATITISAAAGGGAAFSAGASNLGNTLGNTGTVSNQIVFAGGNNITLSQSTNAGGATLTVSAFNQTVQTQGFLNSISLVGNTAGQTSAGTGSIVLAGGPNITLSGSTVAGGMTVSISGGAGGGAAGTNTLGMSNLGNTSGTSGTVTGSAVQFVWAGGNNITLSQSLNGVSGTITISAFNQSVQTQGFLNSISVLGNTTGTTSAGTGSIILAGGNNVTLSGSTAVGGMTLTVIAGNTLSRWFNWGAGTGATNVLSTASMQFRSAIVHPLDFNENNKFPGDMTLSTLLVAMSGSFTNITTSTGSFTYTYSLGIYTAANSTQLSLLYQASSSLGTGAANANISSQIHGPRFWSFHSSQFSNAAGAATTPSFRMGSEYYVLHNMLSSNDSQSLQWRGQNIAATEQLSGTFGTSTVTATSMQLVPFAGIYSATFSSALPATIGLSQLQGISGRAGFRPAMIFENILSRY